MDFLSFPDCGSKIRGKVGGIGKIRDAFHFCSHRSRYASRLHIELDGRGPTSQIRYRSPQALMKFKDLDPTECSNLGTK
jgi:hypothetical protein